MKNLLFISVAFAAVSIVACNSSNKSNVSNSEKDSTASANTQTVIAKPGVDPNATKSVNLLLADYLQIKNALVKDDSNNAAIAGKIMAQAFTQFDLSKLTADQKKSYGDIADDAKENAEHIGKSADKLAHQREHFDMLSEDMVDLVKLFGSGQHLYLDHCPMYNNSKGADWLSETKVIKNPYLGTKWPTCGSVKEEIQ